MYFPHIRARNLNGRVLHLPQQLEGEWNLLLIAFQIWHQNDINTWIPLAESLLHTYSNFQYYELPVVGVQSNTTQARIDNGMRSGIPDWSTRARTITLYIAHEAFCEVLDLPDDRRIYALLVNRVGDIAWASEGPLVSQTVATDLDMTLALLQNSSVALKSSA
jgi:hypothetical protein